MNVEAKIREYLPQILHMSLGTSSNGKPWVCEVHFSYDDQLNLYFNSLTSRRHSQEIASNPHVAGSIVIQHGPTDAPLGVYFEGTAMQLEGVDGQHPAYLAVNARFPRGQKLLDEAEGPDGKKFYKITVSDWYVFDARESRPSAKYHLEWTK